MEKLAYVLVGSLVTILVTHFLSQRVKTQERLERARDKLIDSRMQELKDLTRLVWLNAKRFGAVHDKGSAEQAALEFFEDLSKCYMLLIAGDRKLLTLIEEYIQTVGAIGQNGPTDSLKATLATQSAEVTNRCNEITGAPYLLAETLANPARLPKAPKPKS